MMSRLRLISRRPFVPILRNWSSSIYRDIGFCFFVPVRFTITPRFPHRARYAPLRQNTFSIHCSSAPSRTQLAIVLGYGCHTPSLADSATLLTQPLPCSGNLGTFS